ncbi:MAG: hypothetical protein ACR2PO_06710 [Methyloligellaceae bacterium]
MRLDRRPAALAGALLIAFSIGAPAAWAMDGAKPFVPPAPPPAATTTPDAEINPDAPASQYDPDADPLGYAPGCPLRNDDPPRLLIG